MEIETLKRSHLKRNILIAVGVVLIISAVILNFTRAKYRVTQSIPLVNGVINYTPYDFKIIAMYQENNSGEYVEIDEMPSSGYVINENESYCTVDGENKDNDAILYTDNEEQHVINGLKKNSKCYLYFDIKSSSIAENIEDLYENNNGTLVYDNTIDSNLRYTGTNPNNYVYFNCSNYASPSNSTCELWRIVGIFNENSHGLSGQRLVKLVRNESLGDMEWNNTVTNDWSGSDLQETLNGAYLNRTGSYSSTGITTATRAMIETVTWKLGGLPDFSSNPTATVYTWERGTTVYSGHSTEWEGKIALLYLSDYGYATSGGSTGRIACWGYYLDNWEDYSNCYNNNWLYTESDYWTLTPLSMYPNYEFLVSSDGSMSNNPLFGGSFGVRPSLYLTSDVSITGGTGTSTNPYTLSVS